MNTYVLLSLLSLAAATTVAQKPEQKPLPFRLPVKLDGEGRNCSTGYLRITKSTIVWKFHWATCAGENWTSTYQDGAWVFHMHQTAAQIRTCKTKMPIIKVRYEFDNGQPPFQVAGFESPQDPEDRAVMQCTSMD